MNKATIIISALTAFIIATVGSLVVVLVGGKPTLWQVISAVGLGLGVAAKDTRSLLKLPPVEGSAPPANPPSASRLPLFLLLGALAFSPVVFTGCQKGDKPLTTEAIKFNSLQATWQVALRTHDVYSEMVVLSNVKAGDQMDIDRAWNDFRAAFKIAVVLAENNLSAPTPENVEVLKNDLITLIRSL